MEFLSNYDLPGLFWIGFSLFLIGMSKGGFPIGTIALPILILVWPVQARAAREAVGFMLPMLPNDTSLPSPAGKRTSAVLVGRVANGFRL